MLSRRRVSSLATPLLLSRAKPSRWILPAGAAAPSRSVTRSFRRPASCRAFRPSSCKPDARETAPWRRSFRCLLLRGLASSSSSSNEDDAVIDFFRLFGLPRAFAIEETTLKGTYLKLMTEHHPDKQQAQAQQQQHPDTPTDGGVPPPLTAETITHAYQTLRQPHTRARHWLELHGCPLDQPSGDGNNDHDLVGMDFLMDVLERREALEAAGTDQTKLAVLAEDAHAQRTACEAELRELLTDATAANDDDVLGRARRGTARLQYWHRLETALREATDVV